MRNFLLVGLSVTLLFFPAKSRALAGCSPQSIDVLKRQLFKDYGIQAEDKTDRHSPAVLRNFLFLLRHAFAPSFVAGLKNVKALYAYAGHDRLYDQGAFHPEENAISIGGSLAFPADDAEVDPKIIAILAHELGHAFLLAKLSPAELRSISEKYGGWNPVFSNERNLNFYSRPFLSAHSHFLDSAVAPMGQAVAEWKANSFCTRLSAKNIHEWFAEAFAAFVLERLGTLGFLGTVWRERITFRPERPEEFWSNYNLLSPEFSDWLARRVGTAPLR